ncbi:hypothetical protein EVG20_g8697, partial [Dentipellis fragilis]
MAPIDRLPTAILTLIFRELIALHHPDHRSAQHNKSWALRSTRAVNITLRWLLVTHVSRRWRTMALQIAPLWTTIYADLSAPGTQEMLARSKGLPLDVQIDLKHAYAIPDAVAQSMSRTVHLNLKVRDAKGLEKPGSFLVIPAPVLETCHLTFMDDYWWFDLPVGLFAGAAPRLRTLKLDVVKLRWASLILSNLVELSVTAHTITNMSTIPPSHLDELLEALSRMPNLTSLSLIDCLPHVRMADVEFRNVIKPGDTPSKVVRLPSLSTFELRGGATDIAALLPHLSVPATCKIDITYNIPWDVFSNSTSDIDEFGPLLQRSLNMLDTPVLRLAIRAAEDSYVLSLWTCMHPWPDTSILPPRRLPLAVRASRATGPLPVLRKVQIVDVTDMSQLWQPARWDALLSHMDDVRHIRVNRCLGLNLAQGLTGHVAPRLQTLMFADEPGVDNDIVSKTSDLLKTISESLKRRVESTTRLETLYFQGYPPEMWGEIKKMSRVLGMKRLTAVETIDESPQDLGTRGRSYSLEFFLKNFFIRYLLSLLSSREYIERSRAHSRNGPSEDAEETDDTRILKAFIFIRSGPDAGGPTVEGDTIWYQATAPPEESSKNGAALGITTLQGPGIDMTTRLSPVSPGRSLAAALLALSDATEGALTKLANRIIFLWAILEENSVWIHYLFGSEFGRGAEPSGASNACKDAPAGRLSLRRERRPTRARTGGRQQDETSRRHRRRRGTGAHEEVRIVRGSDVAGVFGKCFPILPAGIVNVASLRVAKAATHLSQAQATFSSASLAPRLREASSKTNDPFLRRLPSAVEVEELVSQAYRMGEGAGHVPLSRMRTRFLGQCSVVARVSSSTPHLLHITSNSLPYSLHPSIDMSDPTPLVQGPEVGSRNAVPTGDPPSSPLTQPSGSSDIESNGGQPAPEHIDIPSNNASSQSTSPDVESAGDQLAPEHTDVLPGFGTLAEIFRYIQATVNFGVRDGSTELDLYAALNPILDILARGMTVTSIKHEDIDFVAANSPQMRLQNSNEVGRPKYKVPDFGIVVIPCCDAAGVFPDVAETVLFLVEVKVSSKRKSDDILTSILATEPEDLDEEFVAHKKQVVEQWKKARKMFGARAALFTLVV